jgi:hypothetical protein
MKKIFLLVLAFVVFKVGYAQYPIQQFIGADSAVVTSKGGMQGRFINQVFTDTSQANTQRIRQYPGAMIYAGGKLWVRNTTATGWTELAYGPISTTNIYNSDGTLTGNRELDGNSNNLTFTAVKKFEFSGDSLYYLLDPAGNLRLKLGNQQFTMQSDTASLATRISYTGNLGSSFTKHSIVDKNYVDSVASVASGTVTSVATNNGTGITGGTITTTGTLAIDTALISTRAWRQKGIDSVTSLINARPSGSGTTNYVSKWTGSTALGNSLIFDNGTSVGIGTATPSASYLLDVSGKSRFSNTTSDAFVIDLGLSGVFKVLRNNVAHLQYDANTFTTTAFQLTSQNLNTYNSNQTRIAGGQLQFTGSAYINAISQELAFWLGGSEKARFTQNGRLLIGTTTESTFELDVVGDIRSTLDANINGLTVGKGGGNVASNTVLGSGALAANTTGDFNVAIGTNVLTASTTQGQNVAVGRASMQLATPTLSVAIGTNAMISAGSGTLTVAVGQDALRNSSASSRTTAIGSSSAYNTSGNFNTAIGNEALYSNTSGVNQVALGMRSLYFATGGNNIGIGYNGGYDITTGTYNTIIGTGSAGNGITTGSFNTIIGSQITGLSSSLSNTIILADGQGNQRLYINSSGNVGINTTSPTAGYFLDVNGSAYIRGGASRIGDATAQTILDFYGSSAGGSTIRFRDVTTLKGAVGSEAWVQGSNVTGFALYSYSGQPLYLYAGGLKAMTLFSGNQNVAIGTTTDGGYKLDVNGTARVTTGMEINTSASTSVTPLVVTKNTTSGWGIQVKHPTTYNTYCVYGDESIVFADANLGQTALVNLTTRFVIRTGASNTIAFGLGGSTLDERVRFTSSLISLNANLHNTDTRISGDTETNLLFAKASTDNIGIGTSSPNASALLDLTSTTKGLLLMRMTGTEAEAISTPADGLIVYINNGNGTTITSTGFWGRDAGNWVKLN